MDEKSFGDLAAVLVSGEETARMPGVYSRIVSADGLADLLVSLRAYTPYVIVERADKIDFPAPDKSLLPGDWPTGHMFGPALELRWEPDGEHFRVLLVGEHAPGAGWEHCLDLSLCTVTRRRYYLWGPGNVALGRDLMYGALPAGDGRPQLAVAEYRDATSGRFVLARYAAMQREGTP